MDRTKAAGKLNVVAGEAQEVAAGFNQFLGSLPDSKVDLTALIAKCFSIASSLHQLAEAVEDPRRSTRYTGFPDDIRDVVYSLDYTFKDVRNIIGEGFAAAKKAKISKHTTFRRVWKTMGDHFHRESGNTLLRRLEYCHRLVLDLTDILYDGSPQDRTSFHDLGSRVHKLLDVQETRQQKAIEWSDSLETPSSPGPSKKKPSFERKRPTSTGARQRSPQTKLTSRPKPKGRDPSMEPGWDRRRHPAPEAPFSDSATDSSNASFASSASSYGTGHTHWISKVFERKPPCTKLSTTGQPSVCLDADNPEALDRLDEEYEQLLEVQFENGDLCVSFHLREHDGRARLLCQTFGSSRRQKDCTVYLTNLDVNRQGQFLEFRRVDTRQHNLGLWCRLQFPSYEQLVLFFCTFLALRSQDEGQPMDGIQDWKLAREEVIFKYDILDDQSAHRLLLLRDRDCGGIRLQASIARGSMKDMPVWTAFITHQVHSRKWMKLSGDKTVLLADLHRYVFDLDYSPPIAPRGEHDLTFMRKKDAHDFMDAIYDLVEEA